MSGILRLGKHVAQHILDALLFLIIVGVDIEIHRDAHR